ncbi:MAG TPA: hypothetical protein PKZ47_09035, partial [Alistipes sp.]|uniref:hypothetical protein n=1 Tax=Alistipes sp. TaxID=1872444 RepID=UPI002C304479
MWRVLSVGARAGSWKVARFLFSRFRFVGAALPRGSGSGVSMLRFSSAGFLLRSARSVFLGAALPGSASGPVLGVLFRALVPARGAVSFLAALGFVGVQFPGWLA